MLEPVPRARQQVRHPSGIPEPQKGWLIVYSILPGKGVARIESRCGVSQGVNIDVDRPHIANVCRKTAGKARRLGGHLMVASLGDTVRWHCRPKEPLRAALKYVQGCTLRCNLAIPPSVLLSYDFAPHCILLGQRVAAVHWEKGCCQRWRRSGYMGSCATHVHTMDP